MKRGKENEGATSEHVLSYFPSPLLRASCKDGSLSILVTFCSQLLQVLCCISVSGQARFSLHFYFVLSLSPSLSLSQTWQPGSWSITSPPRCEVQVQLIIRHPESLASQTNQGHPFSPSESLPGLAPSSSGLLGLDWLQRSAFVLVCYGDIKGVHDIHPVTSVKFAPVRTPGQTPTPAKSNKRKKEKGKPPHVEPRPQQHASRHVPFPDVLLGSKIWRREVKLKGNSRAGTKKKRK